MSELAKLRWRCRRGMRELDQLLLRYLDREWATASDSERAVFLRVLESEDDKLWRWVMGRERPEDDDVHALVRRITDLPC